MHFDTHRDLLTQSGSHTFVFTDASGKTARHTMSFLPAQPASIDLVGNRVLISDTHNVLTLMVRDVYGNISR